jgi:hypothetical protein
MYKAGGWAANETKIFQSIIGYYETHKKILSGVIYTL